MTRSGLICEGDALRLTGSCSKVKALPAILPLELDGLLIKTPHGFIGPAHGVIFLHAHARRRAGLVLAPVAFKLAHLPARFPNAGVASLPGGAQNSVGLGP